MPKTRQKKCCAKCNRVRLAKFFWKNPRMSSGLASYCVTCATAVNRASSKKHAETKPRLAFRRRLRKYGLTVDTFDNLVVAQDGNCAICGRPESSRKRLCIDHNHVTGRVRGLLCVQCNAALGQMDDQPDRLRKAAEYLEKQDAD